MGRRKQGYVTKQTKEFQEYVKSVFDLTEDRLGFSYLKNSGYCSVYANIGFKGNTLSVPISHLIWLLKYGVWPKDRMHLDHIDDDPLNNKWNNLKEVTHKENQAKKIGKGNRYYGATKYGHGISVDTDKRDGRFYVSRYLSSKEEINLKKRKKGLGGFNTLEEAEAFIKEYIENLDNPIYGLE